MNMYYTLDMPEMWSIGPDPKWIQRLVAENILCSVCQRLLHGWFPTPMDVQYGRPIGRANIHESCATGIALIDRRLLERLLPWLDLPGWAVGRAIDKDGNEVPTHLTCYADDVVEVRGSVPRSIRVCVECGTVRAHNPDEHYLMSYNVGDRAVVMDRIGTIYVREDVARVLELSDLKPMYLTPTEVLDAPKDGLRFPSDPPRVRGVDARQPWDPKVDPPWDELPRVGGDATQA